MIACSSSRISSFVIPTGDFARLVSFLPDSALGIFRFFKEGDFVVADGIVEGSLRGSRSGLAKLFLRL